MTITINNMPEYAKDYKYIVVTNLDGDLWFWGAYNDRNKANEIALSRENGEVVAR